MENCYSPPSQFYPQYANCILCMTRFDCELGVEDLQNHLLLAHQCRTNLGYILQMCFNSSGYNNFQYGCYNPSMSYSKVHQQSLKSVSSCSSESYSSSYDNSPSSYDHSSIKSQPQRSRLTSESSTASSEWSITSSERPDSQLSQVSSHETSPLQFVKENLATPSHFGHNLNLSTYSLAATQTSTPTQNLEDLHPKTLFDAISPFSVYPPQRQPKNLVPEDLKHIIIANNPHLNIEMK